MDYRSYICKWLLRELDVEDYFEIDDICREYDVHWHFVDLYIGEETGVGALTLRFLFKVPVDADWERFAEEVGKMLDLFDCHELLSELDIPYTWLTFTNVVASRKSLAGFAKIFNHWAK